MSTDQFGETPKIYIWPKGHVEGTPFPDDFWDTVIHALENAGIEWESTP